MSGTPVLPADQARGLQRRLNPRVTQLDLMFAPQLLVKVLHVEVVVLFLIQAQYFLRGRHRHSFW